MLPKKSLLETRKKETFLGYGSTIASDSDHHFVSHFKNLWSTTGLNSDYYICSSWESYTGGIYDVSDTYSLDIADANADYSLFQGTLDTALDLVSSNSGIGP